MFPDSTHEPSPDLPAEPRRPQQRNTAQPTTSVDDLAEVFRRQLAAAVEEELDRREGTGTGTGTPPPAGRAAPRKKSGPRPVTFAGLLHGPRPPLALLRRVKRYAKSACRKNGSHPPPDVATALYFGVIAAALVRRGERLTTLADQKLFEGFRWMIGQTWLDDATRELAQRALDDVARSKEQAKLDRTTPQPPETGDP